MKTILIGTDFSKASRNASIYGIELAKEINANIILFNAYSVPTPAPSLNVGVSRYDVMIQMGEKLKEEVKKFEYINMPQVETICDEGVAENAIINVANEKKVDFIIIGMKGGDKNFKKIFGSTATSLARRTTIPVIIVPEYAKFKIPRNIVFATEAIIASDKDVPQHLKEITQLFKSKLNVVKVIKKKDEESFQRSESPEDLNKVVHTFDTSFEYPVDTDIRHALNDFIEKHHCDMLVMVPHKHEWIERLFTKSETKNMIFHIHIPLLVLPETSFKRMGSKKAFNVNDPLSY